MLAASFPTCSSVLWYLLSLVQAGAWNHRAGTWYPYWSQAFCALLRQAVQPPGPDHHHQAKREHGELTCGRRQPTDTTGGNALWDELWHGSLAPSEAHSGAVQAGRRLTGLSGPLTLAAGQAALEPPPRRTELRTQPAGILVSARVPSETTLAASLGPQDSGPEFWAARFLVKKFAECTAVLDYPSTSTAVANGLFLGKAQDWRGKDKRRQSYWVVRAMQLSPSALFGLEK